MPTIHLFHPKVTIPSTQFHASEQPIQDVSLGKSRLTAFVEGNMDKVTQLGCFEISIDRHFCASKKTNALNIINDMIKLDMTYKENSPSEQLLAIEKNFQQLKTLAGEGNNGLFKVVRNDAQSTTTFIIDNHTIAKINAVCGGFENSQEMSASGAWIAEELSI
ncbi:hypothetical protein [Shewanella surugensis]|uniref:DUF1795 domain-containing protein n=1 Tax=Shewanella surugensis TaxID=212020 RepID=A0ABT0L7U6_9GAMM|nr:hypothetical protein [Shewanella surugensis]MCL1123767.1 hypothetical protein [Shewanella surugensis]